MQEGICKYYGKHTHLVQSHIVPKSLYKISLLGRYTRIDAKEIALDMVNSQNGFKEPLLCKDCDNRLGYLDRYATDFFLRDVPNATLTPSPDVPFYEIPAKDFNYNNLRRFFISLIWRVSISKSLDYSLGKYESVALNILKYNIADNDDLFVPLIYRRKTNTPFDYVSGIYSMQFIGNQELCVRFPDYEITFVKDTKLSDNWNVTQLIKQMFCRERVVVCLIDDVTRLDRSFAKTMMELHRKYKRLFDKKRQTQ